MKQAKTIPFRGKEATLSEIASELGVSYQVIWKRVSKYGETADQVFAKKANVGPKQKLYEYMDERLTITEWAGRLKTSERNIRERIARTGAPVLLTNPGLPKLFNGKTIEQIAGEYGIKPNTLRNRLHKGEPIETAVRRHRPNVSKIVDGEFACDVMRRNGVSRQLVDYRMKRGWAYKDAISTPPRRWVSHDRDKELRKGSGTCE